MRRLVMLSSLIAALVAMALALPAEAARRSLRVDFGNEWGGFPASECDPSQVSGAQFKWRGYAFSGYAPLVVGNTNCQSATALSAAQLFDADYAPIVAVMRPGETITATRTAFYSSTDDFCCFNTGDSGFQWIFFSLDDAIIVGLFGPVSDVGNLPVDATTTFLRSPAGETLWSGDGFSGEWLCFRTDGTFLGAVASADLATCRGGLATAPRTPSLLAVPDLNANGAADLVVIGNTGPFVAEVRDGSSGGLLREVPMLSAEMRIAAAAAAPDSDSDGKSELVVLAERKSDGRGFIKIWDLPVPDTVRTIDLGASYRFLDLVSVGDADGNGKVDVGVLARRLSDERGEVLTRNLSGTALGGRTLLSATAEPLKIRRMPDADANGLDEYAVLLRRRSDGQALVQLVEGIPSFAQRAVFFSAGRVPLDLAVLPASTAFASPQLAVLMARGSAIPNVVEMRSALGLSGVFRISPMYGCAVTALRSRADIDGLGNPGISLLGIRHSDGVLRVETRNVPGAPGTRYGLYPASYSGLGFALTEDLDVNGMPETAALLRRVSDGSLRVALRNATGIAGVRTIQFSP